jgi:signal transduction histidine kinase
METQHKSNPMLELLARPAFCVSNGCITQINTDAAPYLLSEGTEIASLLSTGQEEYAAFETGCLYLTLAIGGRNVGATVVNMEGSHLFLLDQPEDISELRAYSLAAQQFRQLLSAMSAALDQLHTEDAVHMGQINRRMHQMLRMVSNMSDAIDFCQAGPDRMELTDLCAQLQEVLDATAIQLQQANLHLEYTLPAVPVITLVDRERVERAVYNLLSNAAKQTPAGGTIRFELVQQGRVYLSVTDGGANPPDANAHIRYLRTPSITDGQDGIGLGMVLVRAVATLHGGTVLIDRPANGGTRVTMTLPLRQRSTMQVRSPLMRIDYAGERDHVLQELADVLPAKLYEPK